MPNIKILDSKGRRLKTLYQWDVNPIITIFGLDTSEDLVAHFCNRLSEEAIVVEPDEIGEYVSFVVPNELLEEPENITVYILEKNWDFEERTIHQISIPVKPRIKSEEQDDEPVDPNQPGGK